MKPYPFELLNHFTVPCTSFVLPEVRMVQMSRSAIHMARHSTKLVHERNVAEYVSDGNDESIELRATLLIFRKDVSDPESRRLPPTFLFFRQEFEIKKQTCDGLGVFHSPGANHLL